MSYQEAMEAAGAIVHEFHEFGNHQGTWLAFVTYEGNTGWVEGSYGSCSACDAFEAEFRNDNEPKLGKKNWRTGQMWTQEDVDAYRKELADFGRDYLGQYATREEMTAEYRRKCASDHAWSDDKEILTFLESFFPPAIQ